MHHLCDSVGEIGLAIDADHCFQMQFYFSFDGLVVTEIFFSSEPCSNLNNALYTGGGRKLSIEILIFRCSRDPPIKSFLFYKNRFYIFFMTYAIVVNKIWLHNFLFWCLCNRMI